MKKYTLLLSMLLPLINLFGQIGNSMIEGKITYITLQNTYAKFENTGMVKAGDTIFVYQNQVLFPLFIAESVSSTSCVGKPLGNIVVKVSDLVYAKARDSFKLVKDKIIRNTEGLIVSSPDSLQEQSQKIIVRPENEPGKIQKIRGRLSASSYSSFSTSSDFNQRMRYTFTLAADNISGSKFSTDSYIIFIHKFKHGAEARRNLFNAMKIYSLSVNYDLNDHFKIMAGRRINNRIASVGSIDGIQTEATFSNFTMGVVVGSNPDYSDYSFNPRLFEYGAYLSHDIKTQSGQLTNSMAFFQQTNRGKTDRRFVYFQQDNSLVKNLNMFVSGELDLYSLQNGIPTDTNRLTSLYLSLRYRFSRKLSISTSYDTRKNVIYYETFINYLDLMLEVATRKGYQFRINYNPAKFVSSGISGSYRSQKNDIHPTYNANGFITFTQVPFINSTVSFSTNWLKTSYVDGLIYGARIYRDIVPSKLSSGIFYRLVDYNYLTSGNTSIQHMAELELSWHIRKKLSFSVNYDGTFESGNQYNSIYINLTKRF